MRKRAKSIGIPFVIIFGLYGVAWKFYSNKFEHHIEEKLVEIQEKGFQVSFDNMRITGFPFGYTVVVKNLEIKRDGVFRTWIEGAMSFSAKIWKPQEISSVAGGAHHVEFDDYAAQGQGFAIRSFNFDPMRFEFFYEDLIVKQAGKEILKAKELEYDIDFTPKNEADTASVRVRVEEMESDHLKNTPLGAKVQHIILAASLTGKVEGATTRERVQNWYNNDGTIEVQELGLTWGKTSLVAEGTCTLDENLQPLAAFSASFKGMDDALDAYVNAGQLEKSKAALLKAGFNLFHNANGSKISVTVQNRKLSLSSIPVLEIPAVKW